MAFSPNTVINNFIHALTLPSLSQRSWHIINLPGFTVSVKQMLSDLASIKGEKHHLEKVRFEFDENINNIVASWPAEIDNKTALKHGFNVDVDFKSYSTIY